MAMRQIGVDARKTKRSPAANTGIHATEELTVTGVEGFFEKIVTTFGNGAKIDCPRQYVGRPVYVIIRRSDAIVGEIATRRRARVEK